MVGPKVALEMDSPNDARWNVGLELLERSEAAVTLAGLRLATDPTRQASRRLRIEIPCFFDPVMVIGPNRARLQSIADKELDRARKVMETASALDARFARLFVQSGVVYEYVHDYGMGELLIATARREVHGFGSRRAIRS